MVRVGPPATVAQGLKIFAFGPRFDPHTYTDDDSSYAELWGGLLPTFWDTTTMAPGGSAGWAERWQPIQRAQIAIAARAQLPLDHLFADGRKIAGGHGAAPAIYRLLRPCCKTRAGCKSG